MKHISNEIEEILPEVKYITPLEQVKKELAEKKKKVILIEVGDLVVFKKKNFSKLDIVAKVLQIENNLLHVQTFMYVNGIRTFYINASECRKYDSV
jgi:hypothetical protein